MQRLKPSIVYCRILDEKMIKGIVRLVIMALIATSLALGQTCPNPPADPGCPCTAGASLLTDNSYPSSGLWCIDGSDPIISNVVISGTATVIVCGSVTFDNFYMNGGTLIISSGSSVNWYGSTGFSGEIANYGTFNVENFSINTGSTLYNWGMINAIEINASGGQLVIGGGSITYIDNFSAINNSCGLCIGEGGGSIQADTFHVNADNSICAGGHDMWGCVDVTNEFQANNVISYDSSVYVCVSDPSLLNNFDSTKAGNANVGVCDCNQILQTDPYVFLYIEGQIGNIVHLKWDYVGSEPVEHFVLEKYISSLYSQSVSTIFYDYIDTLQGSEINSYVVKAYTVRGTEIVSNFVYVQNDNSQSLMIYGHIPVQIICSSSLCEFELFGTDGKYIGRYNIFKGSHLLKNIIQEKLPAQIYILKKIRGFIKLAYYELN